MLPPLWFFLLFFFNDTATTEIYTLSLHDALPISYPTAEIAVMGPDGAVNILYRRETEQAKDAAAFKEEKTRERSEEHTSELQSPCNLVCRLLLEKKKNKINRNDEMLRR